VASGETLHTFEGHTDEVSGCAFSPDGRLALSASMDGTMRLWEVFSGHEITQWHTDVELDCCAYGPDRRQVLAGDGIGGVHFLELIGIESVQMALPAVAPAASDTAADATELAPALPAAAQPAPKPKRGVFGWFSRRR
jgi:hypothetical protein